MAKVGDKIEIINMSGEPQYCGKQGVITRIDDIGQLHGTWGGCALIPGVDSFNVLAQEKKQTISNISFNLHKIMPVTNDDILKYGNELANYSFMVINSNGKAVGLTQDDVDFFKKQVDENRQPSAIDRAKSASKVNTTKTKNITKNER